METKILELKDIRIDGGTQPRVAIDQDVVSDYADLLCNDVQFPPVVVFFDGTSYWLADGFHRYWSNKKIECDYIKAEIHEGTLRDAILYSVGANADHGLRRTNADKRKAVQILLKDEQWACWSDSEVARRCGVDHKTVANYRSILGKFPSMKSQKSSDRTFVHHKTGKSTQMNTSKIGKKTKHSRISPNAFIPKDPHGEHGIVPMRTISLPLENPKRAAEGMFSSFTHEYLKSFASEILALIEGRSEFSNLMNVGQAEGVSK